MTLLLNATDSVISSMQAIFAGSSACSDSSQLRCCYEFVMPGLVPGIHVFISAPGTVDGRDKPGHDDA